jgi:hypothetical protein
MDLRYIAEVAKLLVPMVDPPARVWEGLQQAIEADQEANRPARPRGRLLSRSRSNAGP